MAKILQQAWTRIDGSAYTIRRLALTGSQSAGSSAYRTDGAKSR